MYLLVVLLLTSTTFNWNTLILWSILHEVNTYVWTSPLTLPLSFVKRHTFYESRTFVHPWFLPGADICSPIELPPRTFVQPYIVTPDICSGEQMSGVVIQGVNRCPPLGKKHGWTNVRVNKCLYTTFYKSTRLK